MAKRPYKSNELKLIEGNRGKRKLEKEVMPRARFPRMPRHLDKYAKLKWRQLAPALHELGLLTEIDIPALTNLCRIAGRLEEIRYILEKNDSSYLNGDKINPLLTEEARLIEQYRKLSGEFGLTPRGRIGLVIKESSKSSKLKKLID